MTTQVKQAKLGRKALLLGSAMALVIGTGPVLSGFGPIADWSQAYAQSGGGHTGGGGQGAGGQGGGGQAGGGQGQRGQGSDRGSGQRGPSADSDARGPHYNQPTSGSRGGKPVWAQSGIPEVELGRLNVARAPAHVLEKALWEAIANFNVTASASLYSMTAEQFAAYLKANYATVVRIDSPLENLGLFGDIRTDGQTQLPGVTPASALDLAAIFLGSASDKSIPISSDSVLAINTILKLPALSPTDLQTLATKAEAVRQAILAGHG